MKFKPDKISSYFLLEWKVLLCVTLTGLIYNIGSVVVIRLEGNMLQTLYDILKEVSDGKAMILPVVIYLLTTLIVQGSRFFKRFYVRRFSNNISLRMKGVIYSNLLRKEREELRKDGEGEIVVKALSDTTDTAEGMRKFTTELFDTGIVIVSYAVMLFIYDPILAFLSLVFTPLSYITASFIKKRMEESGRRYKKSASSLSDATIDRVKNALTYRIFGTERIKEEMYEKDLSEYEKTAVKANIYSSLLPPLYLIMAEAGVVLILYFGSKNVLGKGYKLWDIAALTTFLSAYTKLAVKASKVGKLFSSVEKAKVSWERIKPLMKEVHEDEEEIVDKPLDVTMRDVSIAIDGHTLFSSLSLDAHSGMIIGITGPVASGKSALGRALFKEMNYSGSIKYGGEELSEMDEKKLWSEALYLPHNNELFSDTISNNILFSKEGDMMPYLEASDFEVEVLNMEDGTETEIGPEGNKLSGGQKERLSLARTFSHPRSIVILDDPFSALDRKTEDKIFRYLESWKKDKIIFLISHRLYNFPHLDKVVYISNGNAVCSTHEALMEREEEYRNLYLGETGGKENA